MNRDIRNTVLMIVAAVGVAAIVLFSLPTKNTPKGESFPSGDKAEAALKALSTLNTRMEVGMNKIQFADAVGNTWVVVKEYVESPAAEKTPTFTKHLYDAIAAYKSALDGWGTESFQDQLSKASISIRSAKALLKS
jgi:hypothetical protein